MPRRWLMLGTAGVLVGGLLAAAFSVGLRLGLFACLVALGVGWGCAHRAARRHAGQIPLGELRAYTTAGLMAITLGVLVQLATHQVHSALTGQAQPIRNRPFPSGELAPAPDGTGGGAAPSAGPGATGAPPALVPTAGASPTGQPPDLVPTPPATPSVTGTGQVGSIPPGCPAPGTVDTSRQRSGDLTAGARISLTGPDHWNAGVAIWIFVSGDQGSSFVPQQASRDGRVWRAGNVQLGPAPAGPGTYQVLVVVLPRAASVGLVHRVTGGQVGWASPLTHLPANAQVVWRATVSRMC